jgi:hypothetical protein
MLNKLENTASPEELIEFEKNTLYIFLLSINNEKLTSRIMGFIANDRISQTIMDRITDGCTRVEKEKEVGSLFPYLDVLVCPSLFIEAICDRNGEALNVYINDIVLANEGYHKKSIIQFVILENESYNDALNKEYLLEIINQVMIGHSSKITQEVLL